MDTPSGAGNPLLEDEMFDLEAVLPPVMHKPVTAAAAQGRPVVALLMSCVGYRAAGVFCMRSATC